jgi:hypothetical protein
VAEPWRFVIPQLQVRDVAAPQQYCRVRDPHGNRFRIGHGDATPAGDLPEMTVFD